MWPAGIILLGIETRGGDLTSQTPGSRRHGEGLMFAGKNVLLRQRFHGTRDGAGTAMAIRACDDSTAHAVQERVSGLFSN